MSLKYVTRNNDDPKGKVKVYFTCHREDFNGYFEEICNDIFEISDCAIYYMDAEVNDIDREQLQLDLLQMQLVVIPVTAMLLSTENRVRDFELPYALKNHIPVLPIVMQKGIVELFDAQWGSVQFLNKKSSDSTEISYEQKLRTFLNSVIIEDEMKKKIMGVFDGHIFLSYRKKDRQYAQQLMCLLHENEFFRDVGIWYDEFLVPGENFNSSIGDALKNSRFVVMAVTPSVINEENYIITTEYPLAINCGKVILPIEVEDVNEEEFCKAFSQIPFIIKKGDTQRIADEVAKLLGRSQLKTTFSPEKNYLLGLAYLYGVNVEVNHTLALHLINDAATNGYPEAVKKMYEIYANGIAVNSDDKKASDWAFKYANICEKRFEENKTEETLRTYLDELTVVANTLFFLNKTEASVKIIEIAIALIQKSRSLFKDDVEYLRCCCEKKVELLTFCVMAGDLQSATRVAVELLELIKAEMEKGNDDGQLLMCGIRGMMLLAKTWEKEDPGLALGCYSDILKSFGDLNEGRIRDTLLLEVFFGISRCYLAKGEESKAIQCFDECAKYLQSLLKVAYDKEFHENVLTIAFHFFSAMPSNDDLKKYVEILEVAVETARKVSNGNNKASSTDILAGLCYYLGIAKNSIELISEASEMYGELVKRYPNNNEYKEKHRILLSYYDEARQSLDDQIDDSIDLAEKEIAVLTKEYRKNRTDELLNSIIENYYQLILLLGSNESVVDKYREMLDLLDEHYGQKKLPDSAVVHYYVCNIALSKLFDAAGKENDANYYAEEGIKHLERLCEKSYVKEYMNALLEMCCNFVAKLLEKEPKKALGYCEILIRYLEKYPQYTEGSKEYVSVALKVLEMACNLNSFNQYDMSIRLYSCVISSGERLLKTTEHPAAREMLISLSQSAGNVCVSDNRIDHAVAFFEKMLHYAQVQCEMLKNNESLSAVVNAQLYLGILKQDCELLQKAFEESMTLYLAKPSDEESRTRLINCANSFLTNLENCATNCLGNENIEGATTYYERIVDVSKRIYKEAKLDEYLYFRTEAETFLAVSSDNYTLLEQSFENWKKLCAKHSDDDKYIHKLVTLGGYILSHYNERCEEYIDEGKSDEALKIAKKMEKIARVYISYCEEELGFYALSSSLYRIGFIENNRKALEEAYGLFLKLAKINPSHSGYAVLAEKCLELIDQIESENTTVSPNQNRNNPSAKQPEYGRNTTSSKGKTSKNKNKKSKSKVGKFFRFAIVLVVVLLFKKYAIPYIFTNDTTKEEYKEIENATEFRGHLYKIIDDYCSWSDAAENCENSGGHLATVTSAEEQEFVAELVNDGMRNVYFLGATDKNEEGIWQWITGEKWAYTNWKDDEPDNWSGKSHVLAIMSSKVVDNKWITGASNKWGDFADIGYISSDLSGYWTNAQHFGYVCEWDSYCSDGSKYYAEHTASKGSTVCDRCSKKLNERLLLDLDCIDKSNAQGFIVYENVIDNIGNTYLLGIGGSDANGRTWQDYNLNEKYSEIRGTVVLESSRSNQVAKDVRMWIYGDNKLLYESGVITSGCQPESFAVDVSGVDTMRIVLFGKGMLRLVDCTVA